METGLKAMRIAAGLTLHEVVDRMQAISSDLPRTHVGLKHIENRGTGRYPIIVALAEIYQRPVSEVAAAARINNLSNTVQMA